MTTSRASGYSHWVSGQAGNNLDPIDVTGARFSSHYVEVDDGVQLRVLRWQPEKAQTDDPLIFVAGWVSVVEGWADLLQQLAPQWPIVYIESREKRSARIARSRAGARHFAIPRLAEDLITACNLLGVNDGRSVVFASSMGSNAVLEGLKGGRLAAQAAFLIGPNAEFRFPWWGNLLVHMPAAAYHPLKHFVIWYLKHFRLDPEKEPDQLKRYQRTLRAAHPVRIKRSAQAVRRYSIWEDLETIDTPVAIGYATSDLLHGEAEARRIVERIPAARGVACPSNQYMHTAAVIKELKEFVADVKRSSAAEQADEPGQAGDAE